MSDEEKDTRIQETLEKGYATKKANPEKENTHVEYYLARGLTLEEAKLALSERQATFSLEKCIEKHGVEKGTEIWQERQDRWLATLNAKSDEEKQEINRKKLYRNGASSKIEQRLFDKLKSFVGDIEPQFAIKRSDNNKCYFYDIRLENKIIEFNGDLWPANPERFSADDLVTLPGSPKLAKSIWEKDSLKLQCAIDSGFDVLVIWEADFCKNEQETLEKCKNFLTQ